MPFYARYGVKRIRNNDVMRKRHVLCKELKFPANDHAFP